MASAEEDSLSVTHREGARYIFVAFLEVYIFLSTNLSGERVLNSICEQ